MQEITRGVAAATGGEVKVMDLWVSSRPEGVRDLFPGRGHFNAVAVLACTFVPCKD